MEYKPEYRHGNRYKIGVEKNLALKKIFFIKTIDNFLFTM